MTVPVSCVQGTEERMDMLQEEWVLCQQDGYDEVTWAFVSGVGFSQAALACEKNHSSYKVYFNTDEFVRYANLHHIRSYCAQSAVR